LKGGAIVDLRIGRGTSSIASYVAMTRVEKRDDMLIYRPFELDVFAKGAREGPELLLKVLRGEFVDWKDIEEKFTPSGRCAGCGAVKFKQDFALQQWNRKCDHCVEKKRRCTHSKHCKICVAAKLEAGTPLDCSKCGCWKPLDAFDEDQIHHKKINSRLCKDCIEQRLCRGECGQEKSEQAFTPKAWRDAGVAGSRRGVCRVCTESKLECMECRVRKSRDAFEVGELHHRKLQTRMCKECAQNVELRKCRGECAKERSEHEFSLSEWREAGVEGSPHGDCKSCFAIALLCTLCELVD
jgi:hypothetical protein